MVFRMETLDDSTDSNQFPTHQLSSRHLVKSLKPSQMALENRVLPHLIPVPLALELHLFFPAELAVGLSLGIPLLDALVFPARFGLLLGVDGLALFLLFE